MNKTIILLGGIVVLVIVGFVGWQTLGQKNSPKTQNPSQTSESTNQSSTSNNQFQTPKKSAHYESNTPTHGAVLAAPPVNIVIDFNFDLAKPSSISITKGGKEEGLGDTTIDTNKLALRRNFNPTAPDGTYTVNYKACWADGSCHDGNFQFAIDRSKTAGFVDMRNKKEISISLNNIAFNPQNVTVSTGTKITWVNEDDVVHTVNTDSHPAHTYFTNQNSRNLSKGDMYSVTFEKAGIYLYHCTPHAGIMTGSILVE